MKNLIIIVLFVCCGACCFYACNKHKEVAKLQNDREVIEKLVYAEAKTITKYVNGIRFTTAEPASVVSKEINSIVDISDTALLAIDILKKQIAETAKTYASVKAENITLQAKIDSLKRRVILFKDEFLKVAVRQRVDTADADVIDFNYNADLTVDQYSKRKGVLLSKKYLIDIYSKDPRITINGAKRLSIEREMQPKFRLQSSMVYNTTFNTLTPGFIGRLEVKRYSLSGSYMYSPVRKQWFTAIGFNYDLIRF